MACFSPLTAWQLDGGEVVFVERGKIKRELKLPCGQCIGCKLERSRQWAIRCVHESQMHANNVFVTLTFNDEEVPDDYSLDHRYFQLFCKRLRKVNGPFRYYMCGEYGEQFSRPHFHACLFGCWFDDRRPYRMLDSGSQLYTSETLERLWPHGFSSIGDVTFESAAYVARYIMKKISGQAAEQHYTAVDSETGEIFNRKPEYTRMSLKPGIGATWFEKYKKEVYPLDRVVVRGIEMKPPRFYDKLLKLDSNFLSDDIEYDRYVKAMKVAADNTPERLKTRETVAKSRLNFKIRSLK